MKTPFTLLLVSALAGCSYQGGETWRRGVCETIVDPAERAECLEDATRSENEYRQDVEGAVDRP